VSDIVTERETGAVELEPHTIDVGVMYADGTQELEGLDGTIRQVASSLQSWINNQKANVGPLDRPDFESAKDVFSEMRIARRIGAEDDTASNALEITEGIALQGIKWEHEDVVTTDLFNQMAAEQNLDAVVRRMWREDDSCSQAVCAFYWGYTEFKVRGKTDNGNARKTKKKVWFPQRIAVLDSTKILPVEVDAFGGERLAWRADEMEWELYRQVLLGQRQDRAMTTFYAGPYNIQPAEAKELKDYDGRLILLNWETVKRFTATKSDYQRWAPLRMKSIFRLIDMKLQLMAADRVALVGAANYILLVKKGDKDRPAQQGEIENLQAGFKTLAKVPVIFSDHRLEIEIITPKQDYTLDQTKYDLIDARIVQRLLSGLPNSTGSGGFKFELGRSTQLTLQGRRHMLKRFLEAEIARAVVNHPKNAGLFEGGAPSLSFTPSTIQVGDVAALAQQIMALRTQKEISRESTLEFFGFDQGAEAMRRELEELLYDDIFQTQVPFSAAGPGGAPPAAQGGNGAAGGRPADGAGKTAQNPTKTNVNDKGNTSSGTRKKTTT
jgi:hypothetical protein